MLIALLNSVNALFCQHEWMTRTESSRLYVECRRCLATSHGIDFRQKPGHEMRRELRVVDRVVDGVVDATVVPGRIAA